jgi:hypothetical protein
MARPTKIEAYTASMERYMMKPALWAKEVCRFDLDQWQVDYLENMLNGKFSAIAGCNGSGKDFVSSIFSLFLLCNRVMLKGQVTGPNKEQIFDVVWAEMHKIISNSPVLPGILIWEKTHVRNRIAPEQWFLVAKTASKRFSKAGGDAQTEGIQGIRGRYTYVGITEASGVEDPNFEAARSCCATHNSYLGVVGNALRRSGFFYDLFNDEKFNGWYRRHVRYDESSWTDKNQMEQWIKEYGLESSFVVARCFGQFPKEGVEDTAIPWAVVRAAMDREAPLRDGDDLQIGVDPARHGDDEAVIAVRIGYTILPLITYKRCSGPELIQGIIHAAQEYSGSEEAAKAVNIFIDESGMGGMGVVDPLLDLGYRNAVGVQNVQRPRRSDRYMHWDDEQWLEEMPQFFQHACLPNDELLLKQLTTRLWVFTGRNAKQQKLEGKPAMKKRGLTSPDRAEAVMLASCPDPRATPELFFERLDGADREKTEEELTELAKAEVEAQLEKEGVYWPG